MLKSQTINFPDIVSQQINLVSIVVAILSQKLVCDLNGNGHTDGRTYGRTDIRTDGRTDGQTLI